MTCFVKLICAVTVIFSLSVNCQLIIDPGCRGILGEDGWRCADGEECISLTWICDSFNQCTDDSDEGTEPGQGCNLFPESKCRSFNGKLHYYCERTGDCFAKEEDAISCNTTVGPINSGCEENQWKCKDGRCIDKEKVCDRNVDCEDESDEVDAACFSHADQSGTTPHPLCEDDSCDSAHNPCAQFRGEEHVLCPVEDLNYVCTANKFATLAKIAGNSSYCRQCDETYQWRCNDGWCIMKNLTNNGLPECRDGSDERSLPYSWWVVLVTTFVVVLIGLLLSFSCRNLGFVNCKNFFHCSLCTAERPKEYIDLHKMPTAPTLAAVNSRGDIDTVDARASPDSFKQDIEVGNHNDDDVSTDDEQEEQHQSHENLVDIQTDMPVEILRMLEDKVTCWDLKERDDVMAAIMGSKFSATTVKSEYIMDLKKKYVYAHTDPLQLHHLYSFLVNRSSSVKDLAKITNIFLDFERELHSMSTIEVLKCWRLNIGCSETIKMVVNSVSDEPSLCSRLYTSFLPLRNCLRMLRRRVLGVRRRKDSPIFRFVKTGYFTLFPFIGASFLYFETIKNMVYVNIVYNALYDLSEGNMSSFPFEMFLIVFMLGSIILVQLLFVVYSVYYSDDIFEVQHAADCNRGQTKLLFKVVALILAPLMPCYVLANRVYYDARLDIQRRHLESFPDYCGENAVYNEQKERDLQEKMRVYGKIRQLESKSLRFRKLYSTYRVTSGVIESVTITVVLVLIMFVTGRKGRSIHLITGVEHRLRTFFNLSVDQGTNHSIYLIYSQSLLVLILPIDAGAWEPLAGLSLLYSFSMVISAIVGYWYQAKNLCISVGGMIVLVAYAGAMTFNRLTTYVSIFSITQPLQFDNGQQEPRIDLVGGVIIFSILILGHFVGIYLYKRKYSQDWEDGKMIDHCVNVLVNTVAVVPFMVQVDPLKILKDKEKRFHFTPEKKLVKQASLKRKQSLIKLSSVVENSRQEPNRDFIDMLLPDLSRFAAPFLYDDLRREIKNQWWANPRENLTPESVKMNIRDQGLKKRLDTLNQDFVDENIRITLEQLEIAGYINVPLLIPAPTKKEYFWLWVIAVLENLVALCIEMINGGVWTSQGHYYSWDIRLVSLLLSLMFLIMYYKKYHVLRDLTTNPLCGTWLHYLPICLCCTAEAPMQAPANEDAMDRVLNPALGTVNDFGTQTHPQMVSNKAVQTDFQAEAVVHSQPHICASCNKLDKNVKTT